MWAHTISSFAASHVALFVTTWHQQPRCGDGESNGSTWSAPTWSKLTRRSTRPHASPSATRAIAPSPATAAPSSKPPTATPTRTSAGASASCTAPTEPLVIPARGRQRTGSDATPMRSGRGDRGDAGSLPRTGSARRRSAGRLAGKPSRDSRRKSLRSPVPIVLAVDRGRTAPGPCSRAPPIPKI